ncbi:hypothetical protein ACFWPA_03515 [Rhodococcus sp. NPDC058505]|uniref:hypothetical protein n=1 Tax=unclassified Rhodococcus (in: high G+C Gram-positive bacteria) TaxID=192944 RepID=UPI00364A08BF
MAKWNTWIGGAAAAFAAAGLVAAAPPAAAQSLDMGSLGGSAEGSSWTGNSTGSLFCGTTTVYPFLQWGWHPDSSRAPQFAENPEGVSGGTGAGSLDVGVDGPSDVVAFLHPTHTALVQAEGLGMDMFLDGNVGPSYQLRVIGAERTDSGGDGHDVGFTSLVWEPRYNGGNPAAGQWKSYSNLEDGQWWSTRDIAGTSGRTPVSLQTIKDANPEAQITNYGVQVGSGAAASTQFVDKIRFGCTTWDFETLSGFSSGSDGSSGSN